MRPNSTNPSSPLAALSAQVRATCPDSAYLAPVLSGPLHPCANLAGRAVTLSVCTGLVIRANKAQFGRCLACEQGKRLAATSIFKPRPKATPHPRPDLPAEDPRLDDLAATLRKLTADGRVRVSMLDVAGGLGLSNHTELGNLVRTAGLNTVRLSGAVRAVAVDHSMRTFLERAAGVRA